MLGKTSIVLLYVKLSLEFGGYFVDAGFGASLVLFTSRRAGNANRADDIVSDLDRQGALSGNHIGQLDGAQGRIFLQALGDFTGWDFECAGRVGLAQTIFKSVRGGTVAADCNQGLAFAANHMHRDVIALLRAAIISGSCDGQGFGRRQILFVKNLRIRG